MLNEEVHITETVSRGLKLSMTTLLGEIGSVLFELRWFILAAFALILADLWFGIQVSRKKGLEIRRSSAGRRTFNKFIDYILYIVLGTTLAMLSLGILTLYIFHQAFLSSVTPLR